MALNHYVQMGLNKQGIFSNVYFSLLNLISNS